MNNERVCDRVYGEIRLSHLAGVLCGTEAFQRLDQIRQLGGCAVVYPSATHTRREHSIGVSHIARRVGEHLRTLYPMRLTADDVLVLEIGGLLHDVGHGPFSHLFEEFVNEELPASSEPFSHEGMSLRILDLLLESPDIRKAFEQAFTTSVEENVAAVKSVILGVGDHVPPETGRGDDKLFLFEVVHSSMHGIDVDKMDYLQRDNLCVFGRTNAFSLDRLVSAFRIVGNHLAFDESVSFEVCELYSLRARMHRQVYQHRAVLVAEGLMKDLLKAINRDTDGELIRSTQHVRTYLSLTDYKLLAPNRFSSKVEAQRLLLHSKPWFYRVPVSISLNTHPRCSRCREPVGVTHRACSHCGDGSLRIGEPEDETSGTSLFVSPETKITPQDVVNAISPMLKVYISDVRFGASGTQRDPHGRDWKIYDSASKIRFCNRNGTRLADASCVTWKPRCTHERILYAYLPLDTPEETKAYVVTALQRWGDGRGRVDLL